MKKILLSILLLILPLSVFAEWVCPAPAGCKIVQDTGECIGCIEVDEPPIIKEEKVVVEKKPSSQSIKSTFIQWIVSFPIQTKKRLFSKVGVYRSSLRLD